jgi:hypothetical protein
MKKWANKPLHDRPWSASMRMTFVALLCVGCGPVDRATPRTATSSAVEPDPKTGITLDRQAFHDADELRKLEAAAHTAGADIHLDPTHPDWNNHRNAIVEALGGGPQAEERLKRYEHARAGALSDPTAYAAEREQLNQLVPDTELDRIRNTFHGYEVYVTGGATRNGETLGPDADLDIFVVVPDGLSPDVMAAIEKRAQGLKIMPDPRFLKKNPSLGEGHTIGVDAKVMTQEQFFGMATAHPGVHPKTGKPRTPLTFHGLNADNDIVMRAIGETAAGKPPAAADMAELTRMVALGRIDPAKLPGPLREKLPKHAGVDEAAARAWAEHLANSKPEKMTQAEIEKDLDAYIKRKKFVEQLYEQAKKDPTKKRPGGVTMEQLELAVKGDKNGQRVPLTFSVQGGTLTHDVDHARKLFAEFQAELKAVFASEGITDAVVVQLGSSTTGWSTSPAMTKVNGVDKPKLGKAWSPKSDADFAIFSDQAMMQAMHEGAIINLKITAAGKFTIIKNHGRDGAKGFADTKLGKKLDDLAKAWNERIYGTQDVDGFDFKLNLQSDKPFRSAVPVLQVANPPIIPLEGATTLGATHVLEIAGRTPFFGVTIKDPRIILPPGTLGRREFHITVLTPAELAALPAPRRAELAHGKDIAGTPTSGAVLRKNIGDTPGFQLVIEWEGAQKFRESLGLKRKDLHVSLNGGIGEAMAKRDAARLGAPAEQE